MIQLPTDPLQRAIVVARAKALQLRTNRLARFEFTPKQREAVAMSKGHTAFAIFGGNRTGKSMTAAMVTAMHLTGLYPDDYDGPRWDRPTRCYAASDTWSANIIGVQKMLLGDLSEWGTGAIPRACLGPHTMQGGVAGAVSTIKVKHVSGRFSTLVFKAYEQGRKLFQSDSIDFAWLDEEPPWPVYSETIIRVMDSGGRVLLAFTPLMGMSDVAAHFRNVDIDLDGVPSVSRGWISLHWDDNPYLTEKMKASMREQFASKPHELAAREKGEPSLGSGACYPVDPRVFVVKDFTIPRHWPIGVGADFGWTNPTAFIWHAYDQANDCVYAFREYKAAMTPVGTHAQVFTAGGWIPPIYGDASAESAAIKDGEAILEEYLKYGVKIFPAERQLVEAGISEILGRMLTGRYKVFESLRLFQRELELYARDEKGKIVKRAEFHGEHLCDAARYCVQNLVYWQIPEDEDAGDYPRRRFNYDPYGGGS